MTSKTFVSGTVIDSDWLNDVNIHTNDLAGGLHGADNISYLPAGTGAVATTVQAKLRESVSIFDTGAATAGTAAANAAAIQAKIDAVSAAGGGEVLIPEGTFTSNPFVLKRFVVLVGRGAGVSILKLADSANADFIVSENFATLTGTNTRITDPVASSTVPSFFGLSNLTVDGNKDNNTSGRGVVFYGPHQIMRGEVMVRDCAGDGIYTEDSILATEFWQGQEEGQFDAVITRNNGGKGWLFRGPHNSRIGSIHAGYNGEWGFISEETANYSGSIDNCNVLHTYANGRAVSPAADTGVSIGAIGRFGTIITDGDNMTIATADVQIGLYRGANMGGERDGLIISGNNNTISNVNASVWASSTTRTAVTLSGARNTIKAITLVTANADNDGIVISGAENKVEGIFVQGFSATGRRGLYLNASSCRVSGEITACKTGFELAAAKQNNRVDLYISTASGQLAVAGATPGATDIVDIRASGVGQAGKTSARVQTATIALDSTASATVTIAHGLLYTPLKQNVSLTLLQSSPDSVSFEMAFMRVNSVDATNVVIGYKLATAAAAGVVARIGVAVDIG